VSCLVLQNWRIAEADEGEFSPIANFISTLTVLPRHIK